MFFRSVVFFLMCLFSGVISGQEKKKIDQSAYFKWKSLSETKISSRGLLVAYTQKSLRANDTLVIYEQLTDSSVLVGRASSTKMHFNEQFVVFNLSPDYDSIRKLKLNKVPKKKWPKDSLGIYIPSKDTIIKFSKVDKLELGEKGGDWVAFLHTKDYHLKPADKKRKKHFSLRKKLEKRHEKWSGQVLKIYNPINNKFKTIEGVVDFKINSFGNYCFYTSSKTINDTLDSTWLNRIDFATNKKVLLYRMEGEIINITTAREGNQAAFLVSKDTGQYKKHQLFRWDETSNKATLIVDTTGSFFKNHQSVSKHKTPYFSQNGQRLFFGVGTKPLSPLKDTLTKKEKYNVDIWSWTDERLQSQQLKTLERDQKASQLYAYTIEAKTMVPIADTSMERVRLYNNANGNYALVTSQVPYLKESSWDTRYLDYYRVDLRNGSRKKVLTKYPGSYADLSPSGDYMTYWEAKDSAWYCMNLNTNKSYNLTLSIPDRFYVSHHDKPSQISPFGGWRARIRWSSNEEYILLTGQQGIWAVDPDGEKKSYSLTPKHTIRTSFYYLKLEPEEVYVNFDSGFYVVSFDNWSKEEGIWQYQNDTLVQKITGPFSVFGIQKASHSNDLLFRQSSFTQYPELQLTDLDFTKRKVISTTNPQQKEYNWGTVELYTWKSFKGDSLSGLLYKPENFDSSQQYPLITYFYERNADNLNNYYSPRPTASIIHPTEYVSNGYLVFIPDIIYEVGHPGKSAYNCVVSGVESLLTAFSYVDSTRMGLQGQSWGGYQTAQLITMTNRFTCAMAGAPVSNMFSAYGGIRWGSGLHRAFQYERGQSRIGKTIWEAPELYIENSPLFHLPKVETPLLIMHNDKDGAVPWSQGIELFNGLRRLNKPSWLLNYSGDQHNLMKTANRLDLSTRMRQFFDYYLLDKALPEWMEKGVPAIEKK